MVFFTFIDIDSFAAAKVLPRIEEFGSQSRGRLANERIGGSGSEPAANDQVLACTRDIGLPNEGRPGKFSHIQ